MRFRADPLAFLEGIARQYGDVAHWRIGPRRLYLLSHPELVREVLVTQQKRFIKSYVLQRSRVLLGEGLLTSEGEFHLRQRRLAQPAFHGERINGYGRTMVRLAAAAGELWRDNQPLDVHREMTRLTLAVVAKTLFDADVAGEEDELGTALGDALALFERMTVPFNEVLDWLPLPSTRRFERARARLDETIFRIIAEHRAGGTDRGDLLSMLLLAQDEDGRKIQNGFQLFMTGRVGYQVSLLGGRVFLEPSMAATAWPVNTNVPESFAAKEQKWPRYFLLEPGLHFGWRL